MRRKAGDAAMGAGIVMMVLALAAFRGRHVIGRAQAGVLLEVFRIGGDRQAEMAAGLATVWAALGALLLAGGLAIVAAGLLTL